MTTGKKPLFELSARELDEELSAMFAPFWGSHPIRCEVGSALMAAEAATQRICLRVIGPQMDASFGRESDVTLERLFTDFEALNGYMLQGTPSRIDMVLWDAAGYINGWFLDDRGRADVQRQSCPEAVAALASMLQTFAQYDNEWRSALEQRAAGLTSLVRLAREKAEIEALRRVQSQGWLKKLTSPSTVERELLSLGFR